MTQYNETRGYQRVLKRVTAMVDRQFTVYVAMEYKKRQDSIRNEIMHEMAIPFDFWISDKADQMASDAIIARITLDLIEIANKHFEKKVADLVNDLNSKTQLKSDTLMFNDTILNTSNSVVRGEQITFTSPDVNIKPKEDWLAYGAHSD